MKLNEILECINKADYENVKELVVTIDDLKLLRTEIRQLQVEINELAKANSVLAHMTKPKALNEYLSIKHYNKFLK